MTEPTLLDLGLSAEAAARLAGRGVRTPRELALEFYLAGQRPLLARLLGLSGEQADALVERALAAVPAEELSEALALWRRVRGYPAGALPPRHEGGDPS